MLSSICVFMFCYCCDKLPLAEWLETTYYKTHVLSYSSVSQSSGKALNEPEQGDRRVSFLLEAAKWTHFLAS